MVKIGIIGSGQFTSWGLLPTFSKFGKCKVIALHGKDRVKAKKLASEYGIEIVYENWKELIKNPEIDLICNPIPNYQHVETSLEAIKYNKNILHEKPAGMTSEEIKILIDHAKAYKKLILVNHGMRFNPSIIKIKELIESGKLGTVVSMSVETHVNYGSSENTKWLWWDDQKLSGGQVVLGYGTHLIDLARYLLNFPKLKKGNLLKRSINPLLIDREGVKRKVTSEEQFRANMVLGEEINVGLFATLCSFGYKNFELKILGTKGVVYLDDLHGLRISTSNQQPFEKIEIKDHLPHINVGRSFISSSFKFLAERLIKYLNGKRDEFDYCTLQQGYENQKILETLQKSP